MPLERKTIALLSINLALAALCALLGADLYLYYENSLQQNGFWKATKLHLAKRPLSAAAFYITNTTLAQNRLNLASWHMINEVVSRRPLALTRMDFELSALSPSRCFVSAIFNRDDAGYSGLMLCGSGPQESFFYDATAKGTFTRKVPVGRLKLHPEGWNQLSLSFAATHTTLRANGAVAAEYELKIKPRQRIGFRTTGHIDEVLLDNVTLHEGASVAREETFANRRHLAAWAGLFFLALLALCGPLVWLSRRRRPLLRVLLLNLSLALSISALYAAYYHHFSSLYPTDESIDWRGYEIHNEGESEMAGRLLREYGGAKGAGVFRTIFIGASQTWGEGATTLERTLVHQAEVILNRRARGGVKHQCINAGVRGSNSGRLLAVYREHLLKLTPDLLVINLGFMEDDTAAFRRNLEAFARLNEAAGIRTVLVNEPSRETDARLKKNQDVMRALGRARSFPVVEMHQHLTHEEHSGFLWWDIVHLSDHGQDLFAKKVVQDGIARVLKNEGEGG